MTDFKASVKIEFSIFGVSDKTDMWINWTEGQVPGVDDRVLEFFQRVYDKGYAKYQQSVADYWADRDREENEARERAQLATLKAKYEGAE